MQRVVVPRDQIKSAARQTSLLALGEAEIPEDFGRVEHTDLGNGAWLEFGANWLPGADEWFDFLTSTLTWSTASRPMYDRVVDVPRLIVGFKRANKKLPLKLEELARVFDGHYERYFSSIGCNWYRDGDDSVAMHRDRIKRPGDSIIAIVSVGARRPFLLKPDDGGPSKRFVLGDGDLLVMGGSAQAKWQHGVPKVASVGARVCMMFRA